MTARTEVPSFRSPDSAKLTPEQLVQPVSRLMMLAIENLENIPEFQKALEQNKKFLETPNSGIFNSRLNDMEFTTPDSTKFVVSRVVARMGIVAKGVTEMLNIAMKDTKNYDMITLSVFSGIRFLSGTKIARGSVSFTSNYGRRDKHEDRDTQEALKKAEAIIRSFAKE